MPHSYSSCLIHCVFSTRNRQNTLSEDMRERTCAYLGGIARQHKMTALAIGGTANHLHVLLSLPATLAPAKAIQLIKGGSSKWVHETFPTHADFAWQEGYAAFSIGVSAVEDTVRYIKAQGVHHKATSFEAEYRAFLDRHRIAYDERYVWG